MAKNDDPKKKKPVSKKAPVKKSDLKTVLGSGDAFLTDEQRQTFIDNLLAQSDILRMARKVTMNRSRVEIPRMSIGSRVLKGSQLPIAAIPEVSYASVVLVSSRLTLPWTVTEEFFADNPDVDASGLSVAESRILNMMSIQAANDMEDVFINGDESSPDTLLHANDGILALATNRVRLKQGFRARTVTSSLKATLKSLPARYRKTPRDLVFIVSPNTWLDYVDELLPANKDLNNAILETLRENPTYCKIRLVPSPFMPDGEIVLTHPDNILFGIEREMKLRTTTEGAVAVKKDQRFYALHLRCDFQLQNPDALVRGTVVSTRLLTSVRKLKWAVVTPTKKLYKGLVRWPLHKIAGLLRKV